MFYVWFSCRGKKMLQSFAEGGLNGQRVPEGNPVPDLTVVRK